MKNSAACPPPVHRNREADFNYNIKQVGGITHVRLTGSLHIGSVSTIKPVLDACLSAGMSQMLFDCSGLKQIDSSGVGVFVSLLRRVRLIRGAVKIARLGGQPEHVIRQLRLDSVFEVYPELEEAQRSFAAHGRD